jgi:hypothetical protein
MIPRFVAFIYANIVIRVVYLIVGFNAEPFYGFSVFGIFASSGGTSLDMPSDRGEK